MLNQIDIPEDKSGDWKITHFEVTEKEAELNNLRETFNGSGRFVELGIYTRLTRKGKVIMSDTPAEMQDLRILSRKIKTSYRSESNLALVNGLGLGIALQLILEEPRIKHLTIIEKSADVIMLVAPHWNSKYGNRLTIVHADAFEYKPPKNTRYCVVWHDIWNNITSDNLPEMHRLHRKYGKRCDWQGSWCRWQCEEAKRQEKRRIFV